MTICPRGGRGRPKLIGSAGRSSPACEQQFVLDLKQAGFDRGGTTKSPQQTCYSMNERKLDDRSRINTADEVALERSVGPNIFESLNDGLVGEPITPSAVT
jgi:hypothetical protein